MLLKVVGIFFCELLYSEIDLLKCCYPHFLSCNGMADITRFKFLGNIYYSSHAYKKVIIRFEFSAKIYYLLMITRKVIPY